MKEEQSSIAHVSDVGHSQSPDDESTQPGNTSIRQILAIISLAFIFNIALGTFLILVPIMSYINEDIGPDPSYTWIASAWTVAAGIGLILAGTLSDILGRRWFCVSTGVFGVVSGIVGVTAKNIPTVIGASAILGLNQAGALNTFAAIAELVPTKHRGPVLGLVNVSACFWVLCGSLIGHQLALHTGPGWRSVFWLAIACNLFGTALVALTYFPARPLAAAHKTKRQLLQSFDYLGLSGIIAGPTLFLLGIIWVPQYGSRSARFLVPFPVGCVIIIATGFWEAFGAKNPLLHPYLFKRVRTFTLMLVIAFVGGMLFYALQSFFPTYLQLIWDGADGVKIGVDGIPMGAGSQLGGVGSAMLLPILGPRIGTRWMLTVAVALQLLFIPLMCLPNIHTKGLALAFSFLASIGIGTVELLTILLIQLSTEDEWIGFATGAVGLARSMGGSAGTAIYSTIFQSKAATLVPERVAAAALGAGLPQTSLPKLLGILTGVITDQPLTTVPGATEEIIATSATALKHAYISAFKYVWLTSIAFGVMSLLSAISTKDLSPQLTMNRAQHLESDGVIVDKEKEPSTEQN